MYDLFITLNATFSLRDLIRFLQNNLRTHTPETRVTLTHHQASEQLLYLRWQEMSNWRRMCLKTPMLPSHSRVYLLKAGSQLCTYILINPPSNYCTRDGSNWKRMRLKTPMLPSHKGVCLYIWVMNIAGGSVRWEHEDSILGSRRVSHTIEELAGRRLRVDNQTSTESSRKAPWWRQYTKYVARLCGCHWDEIE